MSDLRRFVIVGTRAMSKGKLPLNDLGGGAGRMDVLIRALMAALLTSHGIRKNVEVVLILGGWNNLDLRKRLLEETKRAKIRWVPINWISF